MLALTIILVSLALLGHAAFWLGLMNRWHAVGLARPIVKGVLLVLYATSVAIPLAVLYYLAESVPVNGQPNAGLAAATTYVGFCAVFGLLHLTVWARRRWRARRPPRGVQLIRTRVVDLQSQSGVPLARGPRAHAFSFFPGNQLWRLHVNEFAVELPRLPAALAGLSICHWSDLHFSGRIDKAYYHEVVRLTNQTSPDLIAPSGDICDSLATIDWIVEILAPAQARLGKFFILGNHDLRTRAVDRVRSAMREAGFTDVAGKRVRIHDGQIEISGDERPWFDTTFEPSPADSSTGKRLRMLLAHTPDRMPWARAQGFDLMLAGHTHGGQIRLPLVGPLVCPSWHGVKYADGFFSEPPTLLHVSRGTGSLLPLRFHCPPEFTKLILRQAKARA